MERTHNKYDGGSGSVNHKRPTFVIPYHLVAEAVYQGVKFDSFLRQQLNCYLVNNQADYRVGDLTALKDGTNTSREFLQLKQDYSASDQENPITLSLHDIFKSEEDYNNAIKQFERAEYWHSRLNIQTSSRLKQPAAEISTLAKSELEQALTDYCDIFVARLCRAIGKDRLFLLEKEGAGPSNPISTSIGFHLIEKQQTRPYKKFFLKYYSTSGWKLNRAIEECLKSLKKRYSSASTNIEFILKYLLIASTNHYYFSSLDGWNQKKGSNRKTSPLPRHCPNTQEALKKELSSLLEEYISCESERARWMRVRQKLEQLLSENHPSFETILRALLIINEWNQITDLGIYPKLLKVGEELVSYDFSFVLSGYKDPLNLWNYSVVTSIEDLFIAGYRINFFTRSTPHPYEWNEPEFNSFLIARPIIFKGSVLGDFFITGTYKYDANERNFIKTSLMPRIRELLPLLEKEFEYLVRFIVGHEIFDREVTIGWSDPEYAEKLRRDLAVRDTIWAKLLNTYEPTRKKVSDTILEHAVRSALSSIMGRNTSHNIGSHVDFYMSEPKNIESFFITSVASGQQSDKTNNKKVMIKPSLIASNLFRYHRERLDFISEVITSDPCWMLPVRFYSDVIEPFIEQRALLRWIGASDGINEITFKILFNGTEIIKEKREETVKISNDISVGLVSGAIGAHAFYSVLENIIRNSAKHSKGGPKNESINLVLKIEDHNEDLWGLTIYDNRSKYSLAKEQINYRLQEPLIGEAGQLIPGGWGIKEMRICAEYLRMMSPGKVESQIMLGKAYTDLIELKDESGWLAFKLYLPKPKEVAVIDPDLKESERKVSESTETFAVNIYNDFSPEKVSHSILLAKPSDAVNNNLLKKVQKWREMLPVRTVIAGGNSAEKTNLKAYDVCPLDISDYSRFIEQVENKTDVKKVALQINQHWVSYVCERARNISPESHVELWLSFEKANTDNIVSAWKRIAEQFNELFANTNYSLRVFAKEDISEESIYSIYYDHNPQVVVFEHHARLKELFKKILKSAMRDNIWVARGDFPSFVMSYDGEIKAASPLGIFLLNPPEDDFAAMKSALGLLEAGLMKICIVDERIGKSAGSSINDLEAANITLPRINYERPGDADLEKVVRGTSHFGFLVIHQGILDKAFNNDTTQMEKWIYDYIKPITNFVVIISGRGIPSNIPFNARFLPLSGIDKWVLGSRSKFHLVQALMQSKGRIQRRGEMKWKD